MKKKYIPQGLKLFAIIGLLVAGVFAQEDLRADNSKNNLSRERWQLTEINGRRVTGSKAFLEINQTGRGFAGNAGCNRMFGEVEISGKNINFGNVGTTKMFCSGNGVMKLEADFVRALGRVARFQKNGSNLNLLTARNRLLLKFKAVKEQDSGNTDSSAVKLEDKKWVLETIRNRQLPSLETVPFINFDKTKQSAGGNTGCNVFGGNYTATGASIRIFELLSTMRACIEDERMNVEREFKNGLEQANRFQIVKGRLNLLRGQTLLLTFRGETK